MIQSESQRRIGLLLHVDTGVFGHIDQQYTSCYCSFILFQTAIGHVRG